MVLFKKIIKEKLPIVDSELRIGHCDGTIFPDRVQNTLVDIVCLYFTSDQAKRDILDPFI